MKPELRPCYLIEGVDLVQLCGEDETWVMPADYQAYDPIPTLVLLKPDQPECRSASRYLGETRVRAFFSFDAFKLFLKDGEIIEEGIKPENSDQGATPTSI